MLVWVWVVSVWVLGQGLAELVVLEQALVVIVEKIQSQLRRC